MTELTLTELDHVAGGVDVYEDFFRVWTLEDLILVCGPKAPDGASD